MKISYKWLAEFVDVDIDPRSLAEQLTMVGLAVDGIEEIGGDHIIEIDLTSNRPDCLSHLGVAREAGVIMGKPLREAVPAQIDVKGESVSPAAVDVLDPDLCPRYTARVIRGVKVGPSPDWMVRRLEALGQRSINNVADVTNYVLHELGQPLHAFDFNCLAGRRIIVRRAVAGETLITLDGIERVLNDTMLVIADADRAVALAGIMGGADTEITDATVDVLLESAYFNPASVRRTARILGMNTEASYRFERGIDYDIAARASDRAAALIVETAGGEIVGELLDARAQIEARPPITLRLDRFHHLTGLNVGMARAKEIFNALGMEILPLKDDGAVSVKSPSWRIDLAIEEDLIEEIARLEGYDRLVPTLPGGAGAGSYQDDEAARKTLRRTLIATGFHEAISFSFVNGETDAMLSGNHESGLVLTNPVDETQSQMRTTLLGGLLSAVELNINHGTRNIRLFEIGKCFLDDGARPVEIERLALVMTGARNELGWQGAGERLDFYDLKGTIESVGENLGKNSLEFSPTSDIGYLHPGRAAVISLAGNKIGFAGQLHPRIAAHFKFKQPVFAAELDFGAILQVPGLEPRYRPLPKFPTVVRDLSVLVSDAVSWAEIERSILGLNIGELVGVRLFDVYTGSELPAGKRALALSLRYRAEERTLTEQEIGDCHGRVVSMLAREFAAELR
ncbi:MAG: phenylalanine--tRNA ligase subunit beta [Acidobacteria bacterium]|nr:phenylalanine--tRNA ligase subunit beta [Acidobacteriota bacterium]MCW5967252.1 phenylalanine--tRNA ligase subunit beta [Blastocatellales bacterium]